MKKLLPVIIIFSVTANISIAQKPRLYISDIARTNILRDDVTYGYSGDNIQYVFLYNPEIYNQLVQKIPADKLDYLIKYSQRENYPAGLRTINNWDDEALKPAYFYFVTYLELNGKTFTLLEMPAAENKNMPEALRPQTDIYFLTSYFWTNPNFDVSGKKQYSKSIVNQNEKLANEFNAFVKQHGNGMIDGALYFKTILPVPALSKADYVRQYEAAQAIVAKKDKEADDVTALERQRREADRKRRIDSLKIEKAIVLKNIEALSKSMTDDYDAGKFASALTRFRYWKIPVISKDIEIERTGILNNEHRRFTVTSRIEFVAKPGGVDLVDETKFSATMNTNIGLETHDETFLHGEGFIQQKADPRIFNNSKGDHYYEDGVVGNNQFSQEPWNYFAEYISSYNNIPVVPSFQVVLVEVDANAHVYTIGVKMKMPDRDASVVYTPVEIYNEMDKVKNYNLRIKNLEEE